jgi:hypothetical protein
MESKKKVIYADDLFVALRDDININGSNLAMVKRHIDNAPAVDAIPVAEIEAYLQARLDEWNALGDRKWEPANAWGYNFIMACFDDLERRNKNG